VTRGSRWWVMLAAGLLAAPHLARAAHELPMTHATALDSVAADVARDLTSGVSFPPDRPVAIATPVPGDTLGLVTRNLVERMKGEGVEVRLTPSAGSGDASTSHAGQGEQASGTRADSPLAPALGASALRLDVQVDGSGVTYTKRVGRFPFGTKGYERLAAIRANATLVDPRSGDVLWTRSSSRHASDLVPKDDVAYAASGSGKLNPPVPRGGGGRWLEPLIVIGVVTGLVVLFYSNRN
jgi:hypothetical protein